MNLKNYSNSPAPNRQAQKSKSAQTAICDATVDSLIKLDYVKTAVNVVAKKAGFFKGARQYYFPSKEDLVTATTNQLLKKTDYKQQDKSVNFHSVREVVLYIWDKLVNTKPYLALFEVLVAARTDHALKERIKIILSDWNKTIENQAIENYRAKDVGQLITITRSFLRGLVLQTHYEPLHNETLQLERWTSFSNQLSNLNQEIHHDA